MTSRRGRLAGGIGQFIAFGVVGAMGLGVQVVVMAVMKNLMHLGFGINEYDVFLNLLGTRYNIRWSNVFLAIGFLAANISNYQLNRMWTFRSTQPKSWWRGFFPFLLAGVGAFIVQQLVFTAVLHPDFPLSLPRDIFDGSVGLRDPLYWATIIGVVVATPVNYLVNKLWVFRRLHTVVNDEIGASQPSWEASPKR